MNGVLWQHIIESREFIPLVSRDDVIRFVPNELARSLLKRLVDLVRLLAFQRNRCHLAGKHIDSDQGELFRILFRSVRCVIYQIELSAVVRPFRRRLPTTPRFRTEDLSADVSLQGRLCLSDRDPDGTPSISACFWSCAGERIE